MPLVSLKASEVNCLKSHPNFTFTAVLPSIPKELDELTSDPSERSDDKPNDCKMQVDLMKRRMGDGTISPDLYDFRLKCMVGSGSQLLTKMWNKFSRWIKISVSIHVIPPQTNHAQRILLVSAENMTIDHHNFSCSTTITLSALNLTFIDIGLIRGHSWEMKIVLNVPGPMKPVTVPASDDDEGEGGHPILRKILEENLCSDLVITAKNGVEVKAHRLILSAHSPVFHANFKSGMKESQTGQLDMSDVSEEAVRALLDFLYKDDSTKAKENLEVAFELLRGAHKYQIPKLEASMKERLLEAEDEEIGTKMAYEIYEFLGQTESEKESDLKTKIVGVLIMNLNEFVELPEMQDFFPKTMRNGISVLKIFRDFALAEPPNLQKLSMMLLGGNGSGDQKRPKSSS